MLASTGRTLRCGIRPASSTDRPKPFANRLRQGFGWRVLCGQAGAHARCARGVSSLVHSDTTLATGEKVRKFSLPGTFEVLLQEDLVVTCVIFPFCACVERRLYWTNQINLIVAEAVAGHHAQFCATRPHFNSITLLALIVVFASRSQSHPPSGSDQSGRSQSQTI